MPLSMVVSTQTVTVLSIGMITRIVSVGGITVIVMMVVSQMPFSSQMATQVVSRPVKLGPGVMSTQPVTRSKVTEPFAGSPQLAIDVIVPLSIVVSKHNVNVLSIGIMTGIVSVGGITVIVIIVVSQMPFSSQITTHVVSRPVKLGSGVISTQPVAKS